MSLHILYYGFIKVPYYILICKIDNVQFTYYIHVSCVSDLIMASFSPLVAILNQNKLTGSNYDDWKRNLDIVLTAKEHKYVLTQPYPNFPSLDAHSEEKQQYDC